MIGGGDCGGNGLPNATHQCTPLMDGGGGGDYDRWMEYIVGGCYFGYE